MKPYNGKNKISEYIRERKLRKRWHKITALLAVVAVIVTTAAMILPAITMEKGTEQTEEPISWATAYKPGYEPLKENLFTAFSAVMNLMVTPQAEESAGGIPFAEYITGFTVEVLEGDQWVPVTDATVASGDSVRVNLTYTIPPGVVHENSRIIHYQLPAGIGLSEALRVRGEPGFRRRQCGCLQPSQPKRPDGHQFRFQHHH